MRFKQQRKLKLLRRIFKQLDESIVVVEGKRDAKALREAGVRKALILLASGSAEKVANRIANLTTNLSANLSANNVAKKNVAKKAARTVRTRVVLLTDFDVEGKRRCAELEEALLAEGISANASLRHAFKRLFRVNHVEQLGFALERLLEETSG